MLGACDSFMKNEYGEWVNYNWQGHGSTFTYIPEKDTIIEINSLNRQKTIWTRVKELKSPLGKFSNDGI